ncbi:MAG: hypothetical protein COA81_04445 [Alphaproteobacteria bacterium]|nr:MAG: hypothetical protein COA81_04445 [Alphaproteobacteria bacterium]
MTGEMPPDWFADLNEDDCMRMDVRPILARGDDPLEQILAKVELLAVQDILLIEAPFDPLPLRRMLTGRGYASHAVPLSPKHWQVFFKKQDGAKLPDLPNLSDLPAFPLYRQDGVLEMDLRGLEPPNPMIAILKVIESGKAGDKFIVRLMRNPVYLYPELVERNWQAQVLEERDDGLRVEITKRT